MVARGIALGLVALTLAGCEPSVAPGVLELQNKELASLEAELAKAQEEREVERERVKALLKEVRAARELISGRESDAIERRHYDEVLLRRASAEVDQILLGSRLVKILEAEGSPAATRALEGVKAIPERPFKTLVDLHQAQAALIEAIPVLLQTAKGAGKEQAKVAERYRNEIDELRTRLSRQDDDTLRWARDHDLAMRKLLKARDSLEKIAAEGDATSQAEAKSGLDASKPKR